MRILITGSTGMVGRNLLRTIDLRKNSVVLLNRDQNRNFLPLNIPRNRVKVIKGDIRNFEDCKKAVDGTELIIHLAAYVGATDSINNPIKTIETNSYGTLNILEAMRVHDASRLIFLSTIGVYGNNTYSSEDEVGNIDPITPYDLSKVLAENMCTNYSKGHGIRSIILRLPHLYGRFQNTNQLVPSLIDKVSTSRDIEIGNDVSRDFTNVTDVTDLISQLLNFSSSKIYNVGTGVETKISDLVHFISELFQKEVEIKYNPKSGRDVKFERWKEIVNVKRIENELGWKYSVQIKSGLKSIMDEEL
jgi:nucleoside-diphosphate-sugar epimerase